MYKSTQEKFWAGEFGDQYTDRNQSSTIFTSALAFFSRVLSSTQDIQSVMEFGANVGINIQALKVLLPDAKFSALEINKKAAEKLKEIDGLTVYHQSLVDFKVDYKSDLVFTRGVLIHINPDLLPLVYDVLYKTTKRYICLAEYYNPSPTSVNYRGQTDILFKRDFAGEMLNRYKKLRLVDYGFIYHRDNYFPQDDISWFLLEVR